jgi:HNH endonuclease
VTYISLTQGQVARVDERDYEWLSQWKWFATYYSHVDSWYAGRGAPILGMHVALMDPPGGWTVDHRNHDTLDNRRSNLRLATYSQQAHEQAIA